MLRFFIFLLIATSLSSCFSASEEQTEERQEQPEDLVTAMQQATEEIQKSLQNGENVEPADFRELKELLPASVGNMERTGIEGQKSGAMGFKVSTAEARYGNESGGNITVQIVDMGGMSSMGFGDAVWMEVEIDRETETGYERTTSYQGYKAFEQYDKNNREAEMNVLVSSRFMVEITGDNVEMEEIMQVLDNMDLDKLENLQAQ